MENRRGRRCVATYLRPLPPGLSRKEAKILTKVKKRAHHLDQGFKLCGIQCGWTFFLGLIPFLGDIVNLMLSYNLIIKKSRQIEGCVAYLTESQSLSLTA